jgi:ubiquinone biosynthesis protein
LSESQIHQLPRTFDAYIERKPPTISARVLFTFRNLLGLAIDGSVAYLRHRKAIKAKFKLRFVLLSFFIGCLRIFKSRKYAKLPFGVQMRSRLTNMGATYVKLGQILSLRDDMLPESITHELRLLLDTLPALSYERFEELVQENLKEPIWSIYARIEKHPIGSASIAQVHRATLKNGEEVVLKLLKPGTRELIKIDSIIIQRIGKILQFFIPKTQPELMLNEFCQYTNREVDFRLEANNAEEFARNFIKYPSVVFPKIYKQYSNENLITMEFLNGLKPDRYAAGILTDEQRSKIADIGAFAIIKMLYNDGFFHADLHPGNLMILNDNQCAFIDLGMVGRFSESTRKNLLYYFNALVLGNSEAAARYMSLVATPSKKADIQGYRNEFVHVANSYFKSANFNEFSIAKLIMQSTDLGAKYGMYYPMELILMSKAMITFEGVGEIIKPGLDIVEISKKHVTRLLISEVRPKDLLKQSLQNAPEFLDTITRGPGLFVEMFNRMEQEVNKKPTRKTEGMKGAILAGSCIIGGSVLLVSNGNPVMSGLLFAMAFVLVLKS